jgi:hypothetical protein
VEGILEADLEEMGGAEILPVRDGHINVTL